MENDSFEKSLCYILMILIVFFIFKLLFKKGKKQQKENFESNYLPTYEVNVKCDSGVDIMVPGEDNVETCTSESKNQYKGSKILDEKDMCIVDKMDDDVFKFATKQSCDCDRGTGCTMCDMKHSNEKEVVEKICQKRNRDLSCLVDRMENDNYDYMKSLMLGRLLE